MADPKSSDHLASDKQQAESPTTARPIDFDDDQQETGVVAKDSSETPTKPPRSSSLRPDRNVRFEEGSDEAPPPKPPRPNSPNTEAVNTLKEAFPGIDVKVIRAVLAASSGQVEPAFNALLGMSDPDFQEEVPPVQPPRPAQQRRQEEQDELYARQLAQQYGAQAQHAQRGAPQPELIGRDGRRRLDEEDRDYSFFDDDLPEIRDQISKGFRDTQRTINKWVTNFRKTIDGEPDSDDDNLAASSSSPPPQRQNFGPKQSDQLRGIQKNAAQMQRSGRRSTDQDRYDADPRVLSDNFAELELHDAESEQPPPKPARPSANPDLFKPTPALPSGPVDEVDALYEKPTPNTKTGNSARSPSPNSQTGPNATPASSKSKKWQPLTSIAPAPEQDADDDPFKLNSDDEEDDATAAAAKTPDVRKEDTERLKKAAAAATGKGEGEDTASNKKAGLTEHERSGSVGTRDAAAEQLLSEGGDKVESKDKKEAAK